MNLHGFYQPNPDIASAYSQPDLTPKAQAPEEITPPPPPPPPPPPIEQREPENIETKPIQEPQKGLFVDEQI